MNEQQDKIVDKTIIQYFAATTADALPPGTVPKRQPAPIPARTVVVKATPPSGPPVAVQLPKTNAVGIAPTAPLPTPPVARLLSDLKLPAANDPDELLKRRFLCRRGGMLLVGPTGIGKSSLTIDLFHN